MSFKEAVKYLWWMSWRLETVSVSGMLHCQWIVTQDVNVGWSTPLLIGSLLNWRHWCSSASTGLLPDTCLQWAASSLLAIPATAQCGAGAPLFPLPCPFTSSSFALFIFPFLSLALPIFFFCPSLPFLPEQSHSVSRPEVVGSDRTWV